MQHYDLILKSDASDSYRCVRAANSLDIDIKKKLTHEFSIDVDIESDFNIGVIVGASGSGKTTFAEHVFGKDVFKTFLNMNDPVIDQFPESLSYDDCVSLLVGVGLSSVPCWIRPAVTLSNGQRARAEIALAMAHDQSIIVIDEWTSVVDRTVAKAMSHTIQKHARKKNKKIVLLSCHYDVLPWLQPDWVIDCNTQEWKKKRHTKETGWNLKSGALTELRGDILASITI